MDGAVDGTAAVDIPAAVPPGNLKLGEGGEEGRDNDIVRETFERTGASVMGKPCSTSASRRGRRRRTFTPVSS